MFGFGGYGGGGYGGGCGGYGYGAGVGFGGSYTGVDGDAIDDDNGISFGPMLRAGFRFGVMETPIGVGLYYKHGLENAKWKTFGFHVLVDF